MKNLKKFADKELSTKDLKNINGGSTFGKPGVGCHDFYDCGGPGGSGNGPYDPFGGIKNVRNL